MAIITISRGSYSKGKEIAEGIAERLGYDCLSRDILLEASGQFNVPELKLVHAIHDAPSILERLGFGNEKYIAAIQVALLRHMVKDNMVYHGLAGHFFVQSISHVLKIRILADMKDRVRLEMERKHISEEEARYTLEKDDEQRRKWSLHLYGIDTHEPSLYDLVIHLRNLMVKDAIELICNAVACDCFKTSPESQRALEKTLTVVEIRAALLGEKEDVDFVLSDEVVYLKERQGKKSNRKPFCGSKSCSMESRALQR